MLEERLIMACLAFVNNEANKQFIKHNEQFERFLNDDISSIIS